MAKDTRKKLDLKTPIHHLIEDEFTLYASGWLQPLIDELLSWPIPKRRWSAIQPYFVKALKERALLRDTKPKYEMRRAARAAVLLALGSFPGVPTRLFDPNEADAPLARGFVREAVRRHVNNLVTEDLLGVNWRRREVSIDKEVPDPFDPDELIEILYNQELIPKLLDAVKTKLTDRQRQVIQLVYGEDSTYEDAGKELGIRKQTVHESLNAALKKLSLVLKSLKP